MNPKETVLRAFELGIPERVPVVIYGGGMWFMHYSGHRFEDFIGKPEEYAQMIIDVARTIDCDMVFPGSGYNNLHAAAVGEAKIKFRPIGAPDLEEPLVSSIDDLKRLDIGRLHKDEVIQTIWKCTEIVSREIGDEYLVATTAWGPFTLGAQFYGVEQLMRAVFKNKELAHAVVRFALEVNYEFYKPMIQQGYLQCISLADPSASGDLLSRKQFAEFAVPYLRELSDRIHALGAKVFLHICGDTSDRLDLFLETGADLVAIDHKVDMAKVREILGGKICIAGNVNPVTILNNGTPEMVKAAAEECFAKAAAGGGYVLLPGCDIPPTVPLDNIKAFREAAHNYRYC